uniref:Immunoglobulin V-set domain-containing protein n=1 Tax=Sus scrofa TaxID=9823 RepID=A0A8D1SB60_PIG
MTSKHQGVEGPGDNPSFITRYLQPVPGSDKSLPSRSSCSMWGKQTISLLTFWNLPTTAQITVESVTFNAVEGRNILLLVHNATENVLSYHWYRGDTAEENQLIASHAVDFQLTIRGPAHSGREIIYPNGSLLFQNVTLRDSGNYTLMVTKNDRQKEIVTGQLRVFCDQGSAPRATSGQGWSLVLHLRFGMKSKVSQVPRPLASCCGD